MKQYQDLSINRIEFDHSVSKNGTFDCLVFPSNKEVKTESKIIQHPDVGEIVPNSESILYIEDDSNIPKERSGLLLPNNPQKKTSATPSQIGTSLFRLFVKNGEYVYARPNDIIMMESCDHMVKVYLAFNDKIKKTIRHNTLKDFLLQLPQDQFIRIGRFCAVNLHRLSGGNCNEQTFEFDFRVTMKLKHAISNTAFNSIGS